MYDDREPMAEQLQMDALIEQRNPVEKGLQQLTGKDQMRFRGFSDLNEGLMTTKMSSMRDRPKGIGQTNSNRKSLGFGQPAIGFGSPGFGKFWNKVKTLNRQGLGIGKEDEEEIL